MHVAIVRMKRFTLLAFKKHKADLLKELQKFQDVHFKKLQKDELAGLESLKTDYSQEAISRVETELLKVKFSLDKLKPHLEKPKMLQALRTPQKTINYAAFDTYADTYDFNTVYDKIKTEDEEINAINSEISKLKLENDSLKPWLELDIPLSKLDSLKSVSYVIGTVNRAGADAFRLELSEKYPASYTEVLANLKDDVAMLIILPGQVYDEAMMQFKASGFSRVSLNFKGIPNEVINNNLNTIEQLSNKKSKALDNIKALCGEYENLLIAEDYFKTVLEREKCRLNFLKTDSVVLIEGWIPADESDLFENILTNICGNEFFMESEDVEKDSEDVPIKLKNNKLFSAFEDITVMYSLPRYNEMDPTPILAPFYMLFFGLMVGDVGYGLILLIATAIALKFFTLKDGTRKFMQFFFYLGISTIFAGLIYGSMFGVAFFTPIKTTVDGVVTYKAILDTNQDISLMLVVSIIIGAIQVLFALGVKGYMLVRDGKVWSAIFDSVFWIITLLSGFGMILGAIGMIDSAWSSISGWAFLLSLVGLAATQGRQSPTIGGKIGSGLYAVYGLSGYVGDLVSYTRLVALALSGAYIAFSFNLMAGLIPPGPVWIFRIVFGGCIVFFGQVLNLGLGALGAYVHSCRLQYVEFFGKFYEGGGKPFNPLKLKNSFVKVVMDENGKNV